MEERRSYPCPRSPQDDSYTHNPPSEPPHIPLRHPFTLALPIERGNDVATNNANGTEQHKPSLPIKSDRNLPHWFPEFCQLTRAVRLITRSALSRRDAQTLPRAGSLTQ